MSNTGGFGGEEFREESSWRYPLAIFIATLVLCAVFLYTYVGPTAEDLTGNAPSPSISEEAVRFTVGGVAFAVPANHTVYPRDRRGGARDEVSLYALWPTLSGYTPARREDFIENPDDTRRIDIVLTVRTSVFTEEERIDTLFMPQVSDKRGVRTPHQLTKFAFREQRADVAVPTNGYALTDLFLGKSADDRAVALFCYVESAELKSKGCWREYELNDAVTVTYSFKRPYLPEWRAIDERVRAFVEGLIDGA